MYVSIDRENMRFLHKHPRADVVANLAWIEAPHIALSVEPIDAPGFLKDLTEFELVLLYKHTSGSELVKYSGNPLRAILREMVQRLPLTQVHPEEARLQARHIPLGNKEPFRYVYGAWQPAKPGDLWQPKILSAEISPAEADIAKAGPLTIQVETPKNRIKLSDNGACNVVKGMLKSPNVQTDERNHIFGVTEMTDKTPEQIAAEEAEAQRKAEEKAAEKAAKLAEKEAEKARKAEEAAARKAEREAEVAARKAEKEAEKARQKEERELAKLAEKEAKEHAAEEAKAAREANRMPEQNGIRRPKAETSCGRAWSIFDGISNAKGAPAAIREALEQGVSEGLNDTTIKTQYARWRKFHGITGRVEAESTAEAETAPTTEASA